jgi:phospholipase C
MDSRRDFIKKATALAGGIGLSAALPASVRKAFAIDPAAGTTYLDAAHVVIVMQENRSFDHCFGTLQGVRGFNDPRAIALPDGDKVWLQKNAAGETYLPFRLNMHDTKATWIGSLPHSRASQLDARNNGKYDQWLIAKPSNNKAFAQAPLTMGYYNREDLPFYYALADAFTVCDQNFCSSLTGTTPNRLYLWTGTVRAEKNAASHACLRNEDINYETEASWTTFPERLEEHGISWKIYQNELSLDTGLNKEEDAWLSNFTDNPMEWFSQYNVRFLKSYRAHLEKAGKGNTDWTDARFEKLSPKAQSLHARAFTTNSNDPFYRQLHTQHYTENGIEREVTVPKGDVLHQFRQDVQKGELPAVSWLVAPENFSDHPDAPWYGAWYVSEAMDILTQNPEVWKKTIFILCYDENDGYFDHVPPFIPYDPNTAGTGAASAGIDTAPEHVTLEQDQQRKPKDHGRAGPIGLGYRVPLVIASPWSRGGAVCSEVFDHTSILQLLEKLFSHRSGKKIEEENITAWRRTICGDLSAVFKPYRGETIALPAFLEQAPFIQDIHQAQFRPDPFGYKPLTPAERMQVNSNSGQSILMPRQEKGIRPACPLPYQLYAEGQLNKVTNRFELQLEAGAEVFGARSAGCPFIVYAPGKYLAGSVNGQQVYEACRNWNYAVAAGDKLQAGWPVDAFEQKYYHLAVYGPNGFFRACIGTKDDPALTMKLEYERSGRNSKKLTGNVVLTIVNNATASFEICIRDNAYKHADRKIIAGTTSLATEVVLNLGAHSNWYDFTVTVKGDAHYSRRYAGHVETGRFSHTDPAMGGVV